MRKAFSILVVVGLASLVVTAPGYAGDSEKCTKSAEDCCKTSGKPCDTKSTSKADHDKTKDERHAKRLDDRMDKLTKFSFHQSGGFIGVNKQYEVKLADLNEKDRRELEQLIDKSGLLKAGGKERLTKGAADMFVYSFGATEGDKNVSITFDDGTLPESYRGLLAFTKTRVTDLKRK